MKRLLLLSALLFGLALPGCGDDTKKKDNVNNPPEQTNINSPDQNPVEGKTCTDEKKCDDGFVCVVHADHPTEGNCEVTCDDDHPCSAPKMECLSGFLGLDGASISLCREKSEPISPDNPISPDKGELGDACNATDKTCDTDFVCVANQDDPANGTCQDACKTDGGCTDMSKTCQHVETLNHPQNDACLKPLIAEGGECGEGDRCTLGSYCLAKGHQDDVGICTKATDCSTDETVCTGPEEGCNDKRGLGTKTYKLCGLKECTSYNDCNDGKQCLRDSFFETVGHCKDVCDPNAYPPTCPTDQICISMDSFVIGGWEPGVDRGGLCLSNEEAAKPDIGGPCTTTSDCRDANKGVICVARNDLSYNFCMPSCKTIGYTNNCEILGMNYCLDWDNGEKACGKTSQWQDKYHTQKEGEPCGIIAPDKLALCTDPDHTYCVLENAGETKGKCVKYDEDTCTHAAQCLPGHTCTEVAAAGHIYGRTEALSICKENTPIAEGDECRKGDKCVPGTHCLAKADNDDVGICTEATDCSSDPGVCTNSQVCQEMRGLEGKAVTICSSKICKDAKECANKANCQTDGFDMSKAYCIAGCDPQTLSPGCPIGESCIEDPNKQYMVGDTHLKGLCLPNSKAFKVPILGTCTTNSDCRDADKGIVCAKYELGKICTPKCQTLGNNKTCKSFIGGKYPQCVEYDNGVKACGHLFFHPKYNTQKNGEACGLISPNKLAMCEKSHIYCKLEHVGDDKGTCVEYVGLNCTYNHVCYEPGKTCTMVIEKDYTYTPTNGDIWVCV